MKIPEKAKRVFKGVIFDVYQWEQEMYDGSTATFEMLKRPDTVLVIPTIDDKILITDQEQPDKKPFYSLFGGRLDEGEEPMNGAKRELLEESGMVSEDWELWKTYEPFSKMDWQVYMYIARNCKKVAEQKLDPGERITIRQVDIHQFIEMVTSEKFWGGEFALDILKMEKDKKALGEFKNTLFPHS